MSNPLSTPFPMTQRPHAPADRNLIRLALVAVTLGLLFFLLSHSLTYTQSATYGYAPSSADSANAVAEGSSIRKVGYLAIGCLGFYLLTRRDGRRFSFSDPLSIAILAYWFYCVASVMWSVEPSLTLRRSIVLSCCMLAVFGVVRHLRRSDIVRMACLCSLAFVLAGVGAEVALGVFRPWTSGYRFAGTVHPNSQGQLCELLCFSAYVWFRSATRGRWLLLALMVLALALMILTKSRTSCLAVGVGVLLLWVPFARGERLAFVSLAAPFLVCAVTFTAAAVGFNVESGVNSTLTMGRGGSIGSFTGRVPLWIEVAPHILDRPLLGHGYLSFWTPWRIQYMSDTLTWTIPDAHNEYLETLLNLGLVGAGLLSVVVIGSLVRSYRAYLRTGDPFIGFFAAQIFIAMLCGMLESGFAQPLGLVSFITACGAAYVACRLPAAQPDPSVTPMTTPALKQSWRATS